MVKSRSVSGMGDYATTTAGDGARCSHETAGSSGDGVGKWRLPWPDDGHGSSSAGKATWWHITMGMRRGNWEG